MDSSFNVLNVRSIPFVLVTIAPRFIPAEEVNLFFLLETIIGPF